MIFINKKPHSSFIIELKECDMECRGTIGSLGYFRVFPKMFNWEKVNKDKSIGGFFYEGRLNESGWKYIESKVKIPGRGFVEYNIITKSSLIKRKRKLYAYIKASNNELKQINNLISK